MIESIAHGVVPRCEYRGMVCGIGIRVRLLPLGPKTVDIDVVRPKDGVVGCSEVAEHVAKLRLAVEFHTLVILTPSHDNAFLLFIPLGILTTSPDVNGIVRVLVDEPIGVIVLTTATIVAEVVDTLNLLDIPSARIVVADGFFNGGGLPFAVFRCSVVFCWIAQGIPQSVGSKEGINEGVTVGSWIDFKRCFYRFEKITLRGEKCAHEVFLKCLKLTCAQISAAF